MRDGNPVVTLSIATSESWRDKQSGEKRERTEWHRVVIFNEHIAGVAERYLRKGAKVYVEGQLQTRKWTDQAGEDRWTTEVVLARFRGELHMLGGRREDDDGDAAPASGGGRPAAGGAPEFDDEIPF